MKPKLNVLAVITLLLSFSVSAADIAGTWTASFDSQVGKQEYTYMFEVNGMDVSGTITSSLGPATMAEGKLDGDTLTFTENLSYQDMPLQIKYVGTVSGNEIKFVRDVAGFAKEEVTAMRAE